MRGLIFVLLGLVASAALAEGSPSSRVAIDMKGKWRAADAEWGTSNVVWRSFKVDVPTDWQGRRVRVEIPGALHKCDAVVYVNGERAGDILRPGMEGVDATRLVKAGAANDVRFMITESGEGTARGVTKAVTRTHFARKGPDAVQPRIAAYEDAFIVDVFANTSWRRKVCDFEVEVDGGNCKRSNINLCVEVFDQSTNLVWCGEREVAARPGRCVHTLTMPWSDAIASWDIGAPNLYVCRARLGRDEFPQFRFGFREVWREGREIMMNGHKAHFRPVFPTGARKWGLKFLQDIGYNMAFYGHSVDATGYLNQERYDAHDELGMGMIANMCAQNTLGAGVFHKDAAMRAEFERFIHVQQRRMRNHPALLMGLVSQMTICEQNTHPDRLGQIPANGDRVDQIELACELHRKENPTILYFSHADGTCGDVASANLYLNFTPLQEREEWLSCWSTNGILPWCSIEMGSPYNGCWWKGSVFLPTEFLAMFYGERAYSEEPPETLAQMVGTMLWRGDAQMKGDLLYKGLPLYWELIRDWTWRVNSRWRAYGLNGGNLWFNLTEAYGDPPGFGHIYKRYEPIAKEVVGRPTWANEGYDIHKLGNMDYCAFIGGAPEFVDRTHTYYSGEKIEKSIVMMWDGPGERKSEARWRALIEKDGTWREVAGGDVCAVVPQGERAIRRFSFVAPDVAAKTRMKIDAGFDAFELSVWPRQGAAPKTAAVGGEVALFDPTGEGAKVLDGLGISYRRHDTLDGIPQSVSRLVIGRDALEGNSLDFLAPRIEAGLRVFIMRQKPETWRRFGFHVQDAMSRDLFVRDTLNPPFAGVDADDLSYWRGAPDYPNGPFGAIMRHATQRGPRGTRRHTVAGVLLQTPERVGYLPMIVGGFDLDYSALMRFIPGGGAKGSITYCTIDFEGRVGTDPAATSVAKAVFGEFIDERQMAKEPCEVVVCDEAKAKAAGFSVGEERTMYRAAVPRDPVFRGVGQNDLRWPSGLKVRPLRGEGATEDGMFAIRRVGGKTTVFSQVPVALGKLTTPTDAKPWSMEAQRDNAQRLDGAKVRRLYARLLTGGVSPNDGGKMSAALRKALHQSGLARFEPLPAVHLLGPFSAGKDDSRLMLDTVWSKEGEKMAIEGDFNPNILFPLPQGGKADWRPMLSPNAEGVFDIEGVYPPTSFPVAYATCRLVRKRAGRVIMRFGMDWRAKIWCNGKEVFRSERGAPRQPRFEIALPLNAGENVLAFKVGAGSVGFKMTALVESERSEGEPPPDPELDVMTLYTDSIPGFDPWEFTYW